MLGMHGHKLIISKRSSNASFSKSHTKQILKEKCCTCDVMFHHYMVLNENKNDTIINGVSFFYKSFSNNFHNFSVIYSSSRAPPCYFFS